MLNPVRNFIPIYSSKSFMQPVILIHSLGLDLCILCLDVEKNSRDAINKCYQLIDIKFQVFIVKILNLTWIRRWEISLGRGLINRLILKGYPGLPTHPWTRSFYGQFQGKFF